MPVVEIFIQRLDGKPPLVIERADRLAEGFFRIDPSSARSDGVDKSVGKTPVNEMVRADLEVINRTFVARSAAKYWHGIVDAGPLPWLAALDPAWDLIELDDDDWQRLGCRPALVTAFAALNRKYLGPAVTTKMLHLKRPRLVPVCDSLVAHQVGAPAGASTIDLVEHLRGQGRANLHELHAIQAYLAARGIDRSLVRILDALIWTSHPASLTYPLIDLVRDWTDRATPTSYH